MKFRIKFLPQIGYFAQIQEREFLFFKSWYTIGKHTQGFGLYAEDHLNYPLDSIQDATQLCTDYKNYKNLMESNKVKYIEIIS